MSIEFLKELFHEPLDFEGFENAVKSKGFKLTDLSTGDYVSKGKFGELSEKNKNLETELNELKENIVNLNEPEIDAEKLQEEYENLKAILRTQEENKAKNEIENRLTQSINDIIGDTQFTSDYVKNGIIQDMKKMFQSQENTGKGLREIYDDLTANKNGIFENQHKPPVSPPPEINADLGLQKEQFNRMGYQERTKLFIENRELYNRLMEG